MKDSIAQIHDFKLDVTKYFPSFDNQEIILKGSNILISIDKIAPGILHVYLSKLPRADDLITCNLQVFSVERDYDEIVYEHSMPEKMEELLYKLDIIGYNCKTGSVFFKSK